MVHFWLQSIGVALRWLLIGAVGLIAITMWAAGQSLAEPMPLSGDAVIIAAITPLDVETTSQAANLLQAGSAPIAYLAGPQAEILAVDLTQRGVPSDRLQILPEPAALLPTVQAAGHRRLIITASPAYRLAFVRQAQTMGFAVAVLEGGPPSLSERFAATLIYWQTLVTGRAN
ncbi:hypothetical protein [Chloroflexus sp.]|uniref:hypothetical protein n=1 Tax=Chloroflexus sp. TaxID=1904827 RepID=UPI002ACD7885|nr:hypothetical protein [Chloroflexus sp.]